MSYLIVSDIFELIKGDLIIYEDKNNKIEIEATIRNFLTVQIEGNRKVSRNIDYYNLDLIIAVRV